jgi:hypothetical protein
MELNQNGKYCVRIRAAFTRKDWTLPVYFLASSFDHAMRKLEECLQFLQQHEERLRFWGVDHTDDPKVGEELVQEAGLRLDRRSEFPRRTADVALTPESRVPPVLLAPVRRGLAHSVETGRANTAGR